MGEVIAQQRDLDEPAGREDQPLQQGPRRASCVARPGRQMIARRGRQMIARRGHQMILRHRRRMQARLGRRGRQFIRRFLARLLVLVAEQPAGRDPGLDADESAWMSASSEP